MMVIKLTSSALPSYTRYVVFKMYNRPLIGIELSLSGLNWWGRQGLLLWRTGQVLRNAKISWVPSLWGPGTLFPGGLVWIHPLSNLWPILFIVPIIIKPVSVSFHLISCGTTTKLTKWPKIRYSTCVFLKISAQVVYLHMMISMYSINCKCCTLGIFLF